MAPHGWGQSEPEALQLRFGRSKGLLVCKFFTSILGQDFYRFFFRQYYFNLTGMALKRQTVPKWQLLYQATVAYGVRDLSPANMLSIYRDMLRDPKVFEL